MKKLNTENAVYNYMDYLDWWTDMSAPLISIGDTDRHLFDILACDSGQTETVSYQGMRDREELRKATRLSSSADKIINLECAAAYESYAKSRGYSDEHIKAVMGA